MGGVLPLDAGSLTRDGRPLSVRECTSTLFYLPDAITPWPSQPVRWAIDFTPRRTASPLRFSTPPTCSKASTPGS